MTTLTSTQVQDLLSTSFHFRHACKVFDPEKKIPNDQFDFLLKAARIAPSSFGMEPWQLLVVQTPEKRQLFKEFTWGANGATNGSEGQLMTASHFVIFLAHTDITMQHHSDYLQRHMRNVLDMPNDVIEMMNGAYEKFQRSDFHIEGRRQTVDWSAKQAYIALTYMMISAALLNIDSCPVEGFEMDKATQVLQQEFAIDTERYQPVVMAAFGYRGEEPRREKKRRDLQDIVQWF